MVLTKIRNSAVFAREITFKQFKHIKAKAFIGRLLKYHDYKLAILVCEQLNLRNLNAIYEDWCVQMLLHSKKSWQTLQALFVDKFNELAAKLAID